MTSNIRFGIEIETHIPCLSPVSIGGYKRGIACPLLPVSADGKMWNCERDGSIRPLIGRQGCEFISPILSGTEGAKNVVKAVEAIKSLDGQVNASCGVHVTVSWNGDAAALARLIHLVANFETAFYGVTGTKTRETGVFCKKIKQYGDVSGVRAASARIDGRYHLLNITHLANGGNRVEFRCFSASLNSAKILGWIQMCLAAVEVALDGRIRPFNHTAPETAVQCVKRFFATMKWIGINLEVSRGELHSVLGDSELPRRKFMRNELLRMAAKYDAC